MVNRDFIITGLFLLGAFFCSYMSSGNPGYLIFSMSIIGALLSNFELINFNLIVYYVAMLCIFIFQNILMINTYLYKMTYLQNTEQYVVFAFGVFAYIIVIALFFKPTLFK
ncbi:MAG: hypothetical protein ACP5C3_07020 [Methanomicrobiales archaeon]